MKVLDGFSPIARALIVAAAIAILLIFLQLAASVIAPILLAVFVAIVATPPLRWMRRFKIPKWAALALIVLVLLDIGSILLLVGTGALEGFRDSLPNYQERFILLNEQVGTWLEGVGIAGSREAVPDIFDPAKLAVVVRAILSSAGGIFATGLLILLAAVFMLLEAPNLPTKLKAAFHFTEASEARMRRVLNAVTQYMVIKCLTSLATAVCIWMLLWFFAIDFAVLWTALAFFLNFVPYVGAILMMIPAVLLALIQTDLTTASLVALGYMVINTVIGSILEPRIMGRGLGISTLAVFLSLLFWGWVLGTVGVFLSVPLTMTLMIALDASPQTRPLVILLGPEIVQQSYPDEGSDSTDVVES
jgi:predicted PurR-regulated permease PerM